MSELMPSNKNLSINTILKVRDVQSVRHGKIVVRGIYENIAQLELQIERAVCARQEAAYVKQLKTTLRMKRVVLDAVHEQITKLKRRHI